MADEKKGVTVVVSGTVSHNHEAGTDVRVQDGHLIVTQGKAISTNSQVVAVYAPGHWNRAKVTT